MKNKVVFITGAAGGIGLQIARLFATEEVMKQQRSGRIINMASINGLSPRTPFVPVM